MYKIPSLEYQEGGKIQQRFHFLNNLSGFE